MKTFKIVRSTDGRHIGEHVTIDYPIVDDQYPIELVHNLKFYYSMVLRPSPVYLRLTGTNYTAILKEV